MFLLSTHNFHCCIWFKKNKVGKKGAFIDCSDSAAVSCLSFEPRLRSWALWIRFSLIISPLFAPVSNRSFLSRLSVPGAKKTSPAAQCCPHQASLSWWGWAGFLTSPWTLCPEWWLDVCPNVLTALFPPNPSACGLLTSPDFLSSFVMPFLQLLWLICFGGCSSSAGKMAAL